MLCLFQEERERGIESARARERERERESNKDGESAEDSEWYLLILREKQRKKRAKIRETTSFRSFSHRIMTTCFTLNTCVFVATMAFDFC